MHFFKYVLIIIFVAVSKCNGRLQDGALIYPRILEAKPSLLYLLVQDIKLEIIENPRILITANQSDGCKFYLGNTENAFKVLSLTVCSDRFYGIVYVEDGLFDIRPSKDYHLLSITKNIEGNVFLDYLQNNSEVLYRNITGDILEVDLKSLENVTNWTNLFKDAFDQDASMSDQEDYNRQQRVSVPTELWLEISVAADKTLIDYHGEDHVTEYIMALMNVVSTIFKHPSLSSDLGLAITRLTLYPDPRESPVFVGQAKRSLDAVNRWNFAIHHSLPWGYGPDMALWLTRAAIGGPAGYAPVSGVCDPRRSCALNRDEGFSSAFIIAHEISHLLGLTHDGDIYLGNSCSDEAQKGSVMAPTVQSTFTKYLWSRCSREEFYWKTRYWPCLSNRPLMNFTEVLPVIPKTYSMNDQCRIEFGEGHTLCKTIEHLDICKKLWCAHHSKPDLCKTKMNPPLDGTQCSPGLGCYGGVCTIYEKANSRPVVPTNGEWSQWSDWSPCSTSCNWGFSYRTRLCDNPPPANGGRNCIGDGQSFRKCFISSCADEELLLNQDMRADQCANVQNQQEDKSGGKWMPFESEEEALRCTLFCVNDVEIFNLEISVLDGTPCSYSNQDNICIQGRCRYFGCDGIVDSGKERDHCGVCGGDGATCHNVTRRISRSVKNENTTLLVLPKFIRSLDMDLTCAERCDYLNLPLELTYRNRERLRYRSILHRKQTNRVEQQYAVAEGAIFISERFANGHDFTLTSSGRLYSEVILVVTMKTKPIKEVAFSIWFSYTISEEDKIRTEKFRWVLRPWSKCSATCGGGIRMRTVACKNIQTGAKVRNSKCPLNTRPRIRKQSCNVFSCGTLWLAGPWEHCTYSCGPLGRQNRELYCVSNAELAKQNYSESDGIQTWMETLPPDQCPLPDMDSVRPCNTQPCIRPWVETEWSPCSSTCGSGHSTLGLRCYSYFENDYCLPTDPKSIIRSCDSDGNCPNLEISHCAGDASEYCQLQSLRRYCLIPTWRELCCHTCRIFLRSH